MVWIVGLVVVFPFIFNSQGFRIPKPPLQTTPNHSKPLQTTPNHQISFWGREPRSPGLDTSTPAPRGPGQLGPTNWQCLHSPRNREQVTWRENRLRSVPQLRVARREGGLHPVRLPNMMRFIGWPGCCFYSPCFKKKGSNPNNEAVPEKRKTRRKLKKTQIRYLPF